MSHNSNQMKSKKQAKLQKIANIEAKLPELEKCVKKQVKQQKLADIDAKLLEELEELEELRKQEEAKKFVEWKSVRKAVVLASWKQS